MTFALPPILGAGNGAFATAADLALAGHAVRLWSRSSAALAPLAGDSTITLSAEGGYLAWREFDFHRTDIRYHYESGAPYGTIALHGAF